MSRKKKRKRNRAPKRSSATAVQENPKAASPLERLLDMADNQPNPHDAVDMISGRAGLEELSGFAVIFDKETVLAPTDLYLVERHGWPIASPEA